MMSARVSQELRRYSAAGAVHLQTVLSEYFGRPIDPAKFDTLFGEMSRKGKTIRRALEEAVKHASALAPDQDELDRMLEEARCEGVLLRKTAERFRSGRSWLMDAPTLPINVAWPTATLPGGETVTLDFVAQLDLGHVPSGGKLPATGVLFFFVDLNSPLDDTDREARVIHVASVPEHARYV